VSGRLPDCIVGPDALTLRRWAGDDAAELGEAVADSVEHLRPWISRIAHETLSVTERQALIDGWHQEWLAGGDVVMGVFVDGAVAGSCALHRRIGPGGVEIDAAFSDPAITRVEIHHDHANQASAGVPHKLGLRLARRVDEIQAPASLGSRARGRSLGRSGTRCEEVGHERRRRHPARTHVPGPVSIPGCRGPATEQLKPEHNNIEIDDQLRQIASEATRVREQEFEPSHPGDDAVWWPFRCWERGRFRWR
jgi:ribosomal-protein-serine acetyltransferase